jgi:hypothetical protein
MALVNYYAISGRDLSPVYSTGATNTDATKWYTVTGAIATSAHQTAVAYDSAAGIGALGEKSAIVGTTLPSMVSGNYDVYAYIKSWVNYGAYVRVNGGSWATPSNGLDTTIFKWIKIGSLSLKTGDLVEIANSSGGGSVVIMDIAFTKSGIKPNHIPTGKEGARTVTANIQAIVNDLGSMIVGDLISCEYTAAANTFGTFANLGKASKIAIPTNGAAAAPDGTFNFILVGYDSRGRKKLIADRNIQSAISWDALNTAGVASGSGLPISIDGNNIFTTRLLSGGVSATDTDNEWDKIIVGSNLNGAITAGDNAIWNWNVMYSWTSTTLATTPASRVLRGVSTVATYTSAASQYVGYGFRPMLIVEDTAIISINNVTPTHLYAGQHTDFTIDANAKSESINVDFKVKINNVDFDTYSSVLSRTIPIESLVSGNNTITIISADGGSKSVNVTLEAPYRTMVNRTFKSYDGGYTKDNITLDSDTALVKKDYIGDATKTDENLFSVNIDKNISKIGVV